MDRVGIGEVDSIGEVTSRPFCMADFPDRPPAHGRVILIVIN